MAAQEFNRATQTFLDLMKEVPEGKPTLAPACLNWNLSYFWTALCLLRKASSISFDKRI